MASLGVPTTRALAAVASGDNVLREGPTPGGVFTRVAQSHIRIGTFHWFAARKYNDKLKVRYSRAGGGIYRYHIGPNTITPLQGGAFRQIVQTGESIIAIEYV